MEPRLRRRLLWALLSLGAAALLALALRPTARSVRKQWRERRAEAFTNEGFAAWQQGRNREAGIALESAEQLNPGSLRPRLLRARLLLQSGDAAGASRIYRELMAVLPPAARGEIAANYHDALVGTANWTLLLGLSLERLATDPVNREVWLAAALESARLAPRDVAGNPAVAESAGALPRTPSAMLGARLRLRNGDPGGARATLAELPGTMSAVEARMAARLLREAGDRPGGRARALKVGAPLGPAELALIDLMAAPDDPAGAARAAAGLCARATDPAHQAGPLLSALALALPAAQEQVAETFDRELEPVEARLSPAVLTAVWLLNDLAGREAAAARWRDRVQARYGLAALPRTLRPFTANTFLVLTQYLQIPRTLVYGLIACLPEPAPAQVPPRP